MAKDLAEIVQPLVENGLFASEEDAIKNLMTDYTMRQIRHFQQIVNRFKKKYGMDYHQFEAYLQERAKRLKEDPNFHAAFLVEEEDALEWKIAEDMLNSWLGLKDHITPKVR